MNSFDDTNNAQRSVQYLFALGMLLALNSLPLLGPACKRTDESAPAGGSGEAPPPPPAELLVFPDEVRVEDPSVNEFVESAMTACASGDYERFRLLWSVRQEPLPRNEYEEGWQAVQKIEIRALERAFLSNGTEPQLSETEKAYVILADVSLDPTRRAGQREPLREVVLMMVREQDTWRLTRAPKALRNWVRDKIQRGPPPEDQTAINAAKPKKPD